MVNVKDVLKAQETILNAKMYVFLTVKKYFEKERIHEVDDLDSIVVSFKDNLLDEIIVRFTHLFNQKWVYTVDCPKLNFYDLNLPNSKSIKIKGDLYFVCENNSKSITF